MPELNTILGAEAARTMAAAMGGAEIYIPAKLSGAHRLAGIIGLEGMTALCAEYGGLGITVPNARREAPKEKALSLLRQGKARLDVARECGVTERYIRYLASLDAPLRGSR